MRLEALLPHNNHFHIGRIAISASTHVQPAMNEGRSVVTTEPGAKSKDNNIRNEGRIIRAPGMCWV